MTRVQWPAGYELCPTCGQPDNCGDCNHAPLPDEQIEELGGFIVGQPGEIRFSEYSGEAVYFDDARRLRRTDGTFFARDQSRLPTAEERARI